MSQENSRRSTRIPAEHFVSYDLLDETGNVSESGMMLSLNLSREGILVENRTSFPTNATVKVNLAVGDDIVTVMGSVRHVEQIGEHLYRMGIHFEDIDEEKIQKIAEYHPQILK